MEQNAGLENIRLLTGQLEADKSQAAKDLANLYKEQEKVKRETLVLLEQSKEKLNEWENRSKVLSEETEEVRKQQKSEKLVHLTEIGKLERNKKDLVKKLEGLNFRILNAENLETKLGTRKKSLEIEIAEFDKIIPVKSKLQGELDKLREQYNELSEKYLVLEGNYNTKTKDLEERILKANQKVEQLQKEAFEAEERLRRFNDDYSRKDKDLKIYIKRAEKFYEKAFPTLKIKF